jgi:predicted nucleic acid-binding Zn ribbon protein
MPKIFKKNCEWCGKWYEKQNKRFCSNSCASFYKHKNIQYGFVKGQVPINKYLQPSHCPICKVKFQPTTYKSKYCSKECYYKNISLSYNLESHPNWRGGNFINRRGYIILSVGKGKQVYEHRLIMEKHLGRKLKPTEHVHHIDFDKTNNHISNLKILNNSEHNRLHAIKEWSEGGKLRDR